MQTIEIRRNLQQRIEHQRPCLGDGLFHRQHADEVIADAQMIALGFDVRIDHLVVEKLRALRLAGDAPVSIVEEAAEKRELSLLVENRNLHEIGELPDESPTRCSSRAKSASICERSSVFMLLLENWALNSFIAPAGS